MTAYTINTPNGDVKIDVPGGWATEDTLKGLVRALNLDKQAKNEANKHLKEFSKSLDKNNRRSITNQVLDTADEFGELSDELTKTQKGLKGLGEALETAGGIASGVLQGTGRLTDIVPVIDTVQGSLSRFAEKFEDQPIAGIFAKIFTGGTQLSRNFLELSTIYGQQVIDTFDTLVSAGVGVGFNFDDLGQTVADAKIGQEALSTVVRNNVAGLIAFGGDLETGVTKFLAITDTANNELREEFRALGMSTTETAEFIGEFIDANRIGLLQNKMTSTEAANAALSLSREMQLLAELTGQDVDAIKAEVMQRNIAIGNQNKLARLQMEGVEGAVDAFALLKTGVPDAIKPLIDQLLTFDAAFGDMAPLNAFPGLVSNLNKGIDDIFSDKTLSIEERNRRVNQLIEQVQSDMVDIAESGDMGQLGELAGLLGDATLDTFGGVINDAFKTRALLLGREIQTGESFADTLAEQQQATLETIQTANGVIGSLMQSVMEIEDARSDFESALLSQAESILPMVGAAITTFYKLLGAPFGLDGDEFDTAMADELPEIVVPDMTGANNPEAIQDFYKSLMGADIDSNYMGGSIMPNTVSMVGELGPELIKTGSASGEVINNATTRDIIGAASAVMDNMGNNGNYGKQTLDVLTAMAKDQADTKRLLTRILPKAMTGNGYF